MKPALSSTSFEISALFPASLQAKTAGISKLLMIRLVPSFKLKTKYLYILCVLTQITNWDWHCTGEVMKHGSKLNFYNGGSIRGGSSGSIEPLDFWEKAKLNHLIFSIWLNIGNLGTNKFLFEALDSKY